MTDERANSRSFFVLAIYISIAVSSVLGAGLPRGVAPEDAKLYVPSSKNTFTCITHPSINIPFANVNDDYCDCPDGSDEPGTSACAHVPHTQLAIKGFYCANKGHAPGFLPLSRVNDGLCDYEICCDGSDEYSSVGGVRCENRCKGIGQKVGELLREKWKIKNEGGMKRKGLIEQAAKMRKEIETNIHRLETQVVGLEDFVRKLEEDLKIVEEREAKKIVKGAGGKVNMMVDIAQGRIDELKSALETVREEARAAREQLADAESILNGLKESYNPNFNDEGVKTAVRKWDDYVAAGKSLLRNPRDSAADADLEGLISAPMLDWEELTAGLGDPAEDDLTTLYAFEGYLPASMRDWMHKKMEGFRQILVDNGILAAKSTAPTHESKAVTQAKAAVTASQTELDNVRVKLKDLQEDLKKDYGPNDVFRQLKGQCISRDVGEYKYELCFLEKAFQKSLKDSSSTFLGEHSRIEIVDKGESSKEDGIFPADDIMEQHEEKLVGWTLFHENGARCWNGPARSTKIALYCSTENEIRSVVEEEKCVYKFEVGTPAVCEGEEGAQKKVEQEVRDEL